MHVKPVYKTFLRCPRCGKKLAWKSEFPHEPKRQTCTACKYRVYHNPITAGEVYIVRDRRVLLLRRAREPRLGGWDVPGGFLEIGEAPEDGLRREVQEELRAKLVRPQLFGAYATGYRFQNELTSVTALAYTANIRGKLILNHENSELRWVDLREAHGLAFRHQQTALRDLRSWMKKNRV